MDHQMKPHITVEEDFTTHYQQERKYLSSSPQENTQITLEQKQKQRL
jgi:hypothetical protein